MSVSMGAPRLSSGFQTAEKKELLGVATVLCRASTLTSWLDKVEVYTSHAQSTTVKVQRPTQCEAKVR